jgi:hypothetical protein
MPISAQDAHTIQANTGDRKRRVLRAGEWMTPQMTCTPRRYPDNNTVVLDEYPEAGNTCELRVQPDTVTMGRDITADSPAAAGLDVSALQLVTAPAIQLRSNGRWIYRVPPCAT